VREIEDDPGDTRDNDTADNDTADNDAADEEKTTRPDAGQVEAD
jgi:hypothetical protein